MSRKRLLRASCLGAAMTLLSLASAAQSFDFDMNQPQPRYSDETGYGYDVAATPAKNSTLPFYFSVKVPDGNYKVTVTLGSRRRAAQTVVRAESRRLMVENATTKKGKLQTWQFIVSKRSPHFTVTTGDGVRQETVRLKDRERGYLNWDDRLTLEFNGPSPAVSRIQIEPDTTATTLFLCGNSTVVDQDKEPYTSWGQMITRWFGPQVCISNHAESGLTARTFLAGKRLDKILSMLKPGDYVVCEFGHNDEKEHQPGDGAWYHYVYNLKIFIDRVRQAGGHILFCSPTQRRFWEADGKTIRNTHGDFPAAMYEVARREQVPVIPLNEMTKTFFETLGFENSKHSLVHYPVGTYPGQEKALEDNTHFNPYGAYEVAKMVVAGMQQLQLPFLGALRNDWTGFDPAQPDSWSEFRWYNSAVLDTTKPDGI